MAISPKKAVTGVGEFAAGLGIMLGLFFIVIFGIFFFVKGASYLATTAIPFMSHITYPVFALCLLILLPLCFFKGTKTFGLTSLFTLTYFFGILAWLIGFITTYYYLGLIWLIIGLFFAGIGVVPMGIFAAFTHHRADVGFSLLLLLLFAYGFRFFVLWYAEKDETLSRDYARDVIDVDDYDNYDINNVPDELPVQSPVQPVVQHTTHHATHNIEHKIPKRRDI